MQLLLTLYIVSPSRIQQELAPLISALIDELCATAIDIAISSPAGRLDPPLLLALDEVANLRAMPQGRALALPQGHDPIPLDLHAGTPGLNPACDWKTICRKGRQQLRRTHAVQAASVVPGR